MKKIFVVLGILSLILPIVSCAKTEVEEVEEVEDSYYVQYTVSSQGSGYSTYSVKDIGSNLRQSDFPETYGPVKKGYKANIKWTTGSGHYSKAQILVSKNGEPFATKASSSNYSYSGELSYTI